MIEVSDLLQKFRKIQRVLVYVLIINIIISLAKIIYGALTGASSMVAEDVYKRQDEEVCELLDKAANFQSKLQ